MLLNDITPVNKENINSNSLLARMDSHPAHPLRPMTAKHKATNASSFGRLYGKAGFISSEDQLSMVSESVEPKIISTTFQLLKKRTGIPPTAPKRVGSAVVPKLNLSTK